MNLRCQDEQRVGKAPEVSGAEEIEVFLGWYWVRQ